MRILAWNVWGGSRPGISEVVRAASPDVAVLSEFLPGHFDRVAKELRTSGFDWVVGTNQADYAGLVIASNVPMEAGSTSSAVLPEHWCHVWIPSAKVSVVGIYGPLRRKGFPKLVPAFWDELVRSAAQLAG